MAILKNHPQYKTIRAVSKKQKKKVPVTKPQVRAMISKRAETLRNNFWTTITDTGTGPTTQNYTAMGVGDDDGYRTGRQIRGVSLWLGFHVNTLAAGQYCRIITYMCTGKKTVADMETAFASATYNNQLDLRDWLILDDKFVINQEGGNEQVLYEKKIVWPLSKRPVIEYTGTASSDCIRHQIATTIAGSNNDIVIYPNCRFFYKDA